MIDTQQPLAHQHSLSMSPKIHHAKMMMMIPPPPSAADADETIVVAMTPPTPGMRNRRRRYVKFNSTIHNRPIPHLDDMTQEEISEKWIQPEEYLEIRKRCISTVQKMMNSTLTELDVESERHCPRGLEGKTREGAKRRKDNKLDALAAVLEEQSMQWDEDVDDEEAIMEVYSVFSIPCGEDAHLQALEDALEVQQYILMTAADESLSSIPLSQSNPLDDDDDANEEEAVVFLEDDNEDEGTVVHKLKDIFSHKSSRAALLQEIEKTYYNEASIERRRKRKEESDSIHKGHREDKTSLMLQMKEYFMARNVKHVSCDSEEDDDETMTTATNSSFESEDSSSHQNQDEISGRLNPDEFFTTQLHDIFHSRQRRQALLDEIESNYFHDSEDLEEEDQDHQIISFPSISVSLLTQRLGNRLCEIFYFKSTRAALLDELGSSHHLRQ